MLIGARVVLAVLVSGQVVTAEGAGLAGPTDHDEARRWLAGVPVPFLSNQGQTDPAVAYYVPTFAGTTFVTRRGELVYSLRGKHRKGLSRWTLTETLVGRTPHPLGQDEGCARASYFISSERSRWRTGIGTFSSIALGEVWPGVRVFLRAHGTSVEKLFVLSPSVSAGEIRVQVSGARSLRVDAKGRLVARVGPGRIAWTTPVAYQEAAGERHPVRVSYWIGGTGREYGFHLGAHDRRLPVTIDPLLQATYLGGSLNDYAFGLAIHPRTGEVFVSGRTESLNFPGVAGGAQTSYGGGIDNPFVARLNPTLAVLEQATYFGGRGIDYPIAMAIHPITDEVFVVGHTGSTDLPGTAGGAQERYGGNYDGFVARFSPTLTELKQATYLGGSGGDGAETMAIDPVSGDVFVAGETSSTDFPGTAGGAQAVHGGLGGRFVAYNGFIARLNPALTKLRQATYLGGNGTDVAVGLAIHPISGEVLVAGETDSTNFPGTAAGAQAEPGEGVGNAFVARLDPTLIVLKGSTYLGGDWVTGAVSVAIDPVAGDVLIAGDTSSTNLPGTSGGAQSANGGMWDGFVARLDASLATLRQATYLGGSGMDSVTALAIHPMTGEVFVAGETTLGDLPATAGGAQSSYGGGVLDAFVARFDSTLTLLNQTTYLGGSDRETAYALGINPMGEIVVAGDTRSTDFPATGGGAQPSYGGGDLYGGDAFVARFTRDLAAGPATVPGLTDPARPPIWKSTHRPLPRSTGPR